MSSQSWLLYLSLVFVATATPGPAVLYIITSSGLCGWKKSVFAALGNITGLLILGAIAVTGLGTLLQASVILFSVIKYTGAAYLIYLGLKMFFQKSAPVFEPDSKPFGVEISSTKIFLQAFGIAMSNPKAIVFMTALFPQFILIDRALVPQFATLIATLMTFSFVFLMSYAILADRARTWLSSGKRLKMFNRTGGSAFVGFGVLLATSSNR